MESQKLWGGRFVKPTDPKLEKLNCSLAVDKRMYAEDIEGSKAFAYALQNINLLTEDEEARLDKIRIEWDNAEFVTLSEDEDIHCQNISPFFL
uniref:Fumarate lyase N-terminal domain-containing protein n=1 Tax=Dendroctonus ponderosae TaxID=77166 RepID=A0AAR5PMM6_DENPD